ncbi:MAG: hypothetical protein AAFN40_27035 [Cyanobacteria bacterium J06560_6]
MMPTFWATVRRGKIELTELADLPEGTKVLVTLLSEDRSPTAQSIEQDLSTNNPQQSEKKFWRIASQTSLDTVWENTEDDIYTQLL